MFFSISVVVTAVRPRCSESIAGYGKAILVQVSRTLDMIVREIDEGIGNTSHGLMVGEFPRIFKGGRADMVNIQIKWGMAVFVNTTINEIEYRDRVEIYMVSVRYQRTIYSSLKGDGSYMGCIASRLSSAKMWVWS